MKNSAYQSNRTTLLQVVLLGKTEQHICPQPNALAMPERNPRQAKPMMMSSTSTVKENGQS
ncbi:hypothetical protein C497_02242 [Halalkalicoccus jeotgali B3]|uniref:Uncharacterized protein n=1 Tax=Halalkalicoccus jeotgali (strain DSM 18796 / CECT 7217 / JCM 14584 / KCTC 4019 / B3) TaxID=795797 RepID=L9VUJ5_HALJB|nr:hypothetical protein C497_02242 [Halalkalicoccus jeotgali B3]